MAKSTILRVKRRLEDNPQDAFVITCKRLKTTQEELSPSLFVFRGTVVNQETIVVKGLVPKDDPKKLVTNVEDIIDKIRKERKAASNKHRYEIVKTNRGISDVDEKFNFVDLERKEQEESDAKYAYDLYIAAKHDFDISMLDDLVSIENYETELVIGTFRDNGLRAPSSEEDSSDDSNDENNWRNDYPDEDNSINEDDMVQAMERVDLDELSSDGGEEKIYEDGTFNDDVSRYGEAYAKYKARVTSEQKLGDNNLVHCHTIPQVEEGYKSDSDDGFYYGEDEDTEHFKEQYKKNLSDDFDTH